MALTVLKYGHPMLRQKGARIEQVTPEIKRLIGEMLETMYGARGIGLAAQQIGRALQMTIIDLREVADRPSTLEMKGEPIEIAHFMPLVLINPQVTPVADPVSGPEGCLSFSEIYAEIARPESVEVTALNEQGERVEFRCGGLLARAVQHETDHLQGILFIDRMTREAKEEIKPQLERLQAETKAALKDLGH